MSDDDLSKVISKYNRLGKKEQRKARRSANSLSSYIADGALRFFIFSYKFTFPTVWEVRRNFAYIVLGLLGFFATNYYF